jgi:hypothetical protein
MWLPPTQAGGQVLGNTSIDGAHVVLAGPARGQLCILYQNSEVDEQFLLYFAKCLCAHIHQYLCKEKHFTRRCYVRQSLAPGLKPKKDSEQLTLAGVQPCIEQLLLSVFLTKPTYKIWPGWA